jgi:glucosamine--fructose-6-phosphate aminotransferase (isomerizing)
MAKKENYTYTEIKSQPEILPEVLKNFQPLRSDLTSFWKSNDFEQVIFTGCGSTYHISKTAAALFQSLTGMPCFFYPGSEMVLFPDIVYPKDRRTLLVAESRSGETTETVEGVSVFRQVTGGKVLAITCDSQSTLAKLADLTLAADVAQEKSVAQTRSFSSMLLLSEAFAGHIAGKDLTILERLPAEIDRLFSSYEDLAKELGEDKQIDANFYLGSGLLYGLACEAMLKLKEMSLSVSEAFHVMDFRHGPMSLVNKTSIVIGLLSETALTQEVAVMNHMHNLGGRILSISEKPHPDLQKIGDLVLLETGLPPWANALVYLPFLQLYAYYRSLSKGLNPDAPNNLEAVIILK